MLTWRNDPEPRAPIAAMLGDIEAGRIYKGRDDGFVAYCYLRTGAFASREWSSGIVPSIEAAQAALTSAVEEWICRAGLVVRDVK